MTKKPYRKAPRVSRSPQPAAPTRPGRHYAKLQPDGDEHPVDVAVNRILAIARLRRKLLRMSLEFRKQVRDQQMFIEYEDRRLEYAVRRQEAFFDLGFEQGRLEGIAENLGAGSATNADARELAKQIRLAALATALPPERAVAVMLELARAVVLGVELPRPIRR